jgi:hypothetical protein
VREFLPFESEKINLVVISEAIRKMVAIEQQASFTADSSVVLQHCEPITVDQNVPRLREKSLG